MFIVSRIAQDGEVCCDRCPMAPLIPKWSQAHDANVFDYQQQLDPDWRWRNSRDYELLRLTSVEMLADVLEEDEKEQLAADYTLADVYDADQYRDKVEVLYEYDMGDGWEHDVLFLGKESAGLRNTISVPAQRFQEAICLGGEVRVH
jgi:hypothetical protein